MLSLAERAERSVGELAQLLVGHCYSIALINNVTTRRHKVVDIVTQLIPICDRTEMFIISRDWVTLNICRVPAITSSIISLTGNTNYKETFVPLPLATTLAEEFELLKMDQKMAVCAVLAMLFTLDVGLFEILTEIDCHQLCFTAQRSKNNMKNICDKICIKSPIDWDYAICAVNKLKEIFYALK